MHEKWTRDRCKLWLVRRESTWSGTRVETHFQTNLSVITFTTRFNLRTNSNLICKFSVDFLALSKNYTRARKVSVFFNVSTTCTNEWFNSYYFFRSCFPFNNRGDSSKRELKWNEQNKINTWKTKIKNVKEHTAHMKFWRNSGYWCSSLPLPPRLLFCIWQTRLDGSFHSWQTFLLPLRDTGEGLSRSSQFSVALLLAHFEFIIHDGFSGRFVYESERYDGVMLPLFILVVVKNLLFCAHWTQHNALRQVVDDRQKGTLCEFLSN